LGKNRKILVIGLDGATFYILDKMIDSGLMPNLAKIITNGVRGELTSIITTNSAAAWISIMTGTGPGKHSIFEFRSCSPNNLYHKTIVSSRSIKRPTLLQILSYKGKTVGSLNVPVTYPPPAINGFIVSGMLTPSITHPATYPKNLYSELIDAIGEYIIDTPYIFYENRIEAFIEDLQAMMLKRTEAIMYLWQRYKPDFQIAVIAALDRLQHCLWRYIDTEHPRYNPKASKRHANHINQFFSNLDLCLKKVLQVIDNNTTLFIISDHGFQACDLQFSINEWLANVGLLNYSSGRKSALIKYLKSLDSPVFWKLRRWYRRSALGQFKMLSSTKEINWHNTKAYCPFDNQQAISINLSGREKHGIIKPGKEYKLLLNLLKEMLHELKDPKTGAKVAKQVFLREEYFTGPFMELAPDLIMVPNVNFKISPPHRKGMLFKPTGWISGEHSLEGIFIAYGNGIKSGTIIDDAAIVDIAPTILHLMEYNQAIDMDGKVLHKIFASSS
jgi:predicted AlkP superfamily phosphohydrolase/phosphomutase